MVDKDDLLVEVRVKTAFALGGGEASAAARVREDSPEARRRLLTDLSDNLLRGEVGVFPLLGGPDRLLSASASFLRAGNGRPLLADALGRADRLCNP